MIINDSIIRLHGLDYISFSILNISSNQKQDAGQLIGILNHLQQLSCRIEDCILLLHFTNYVRIIAINLIVEMIQTGPISHIGVE